MPKTTPHITPPEHLEMGDKNHTPSLHLPRRKLSLPPRIKTTREWNDKTKKPLSATPNVQSREDFTHLRRGSTSGGSSGLGIIDTECGYHVCPKIARQEGKGEGCGHLDI